MTVIELIRELIQHNNLNKEVVLSHYNYQSKKYEIEKFIVTPDDDDNEVVMFVTEKDIEGYESQLLL